MLDRVDDRTRAELSQEAPRIGLGELTLVGRLEIDVGKIRERLTGRGWSCPTAAVP